MKDGKGFSLIEIIVAVAVMAILAGALLPSMFDRLNQARHAKMMQDMEAIYEATMGVPSEDYFGFVGDVGRLPDSTAELIANPGLTNWNGPYLSVGGTMKLKDVYGSEYVIDQDSIRVRSYGADRSDDSGGDDDLVYPENALTSYKGLLEVQVFINGRLISDAAAEQVSASLAYVNNGTPTSTTLNFSTSDFTFTPPDSVHQGFHLLTVTASKVSLGGQDPTTTHTEQLTILPGATTSLQVNFSDADYMTRLDSDLNGNGIPDRLEDMDGDGIPDDLDNDIDGDGVPNAIDDDPYDPTVGGGGGGGQVAPVVTSVTPNYGNQGDTNLSLTIDGSYFQDSATVIFSGTGITVLTVPATFNGSTQLVIDVNIGGAASTGWRNVSVNNPDGLSGTGENIFQVLSAGQDPAPAINQVIPDSALQGVVDLPISIQGQNFQPGIQTTFSNPGITITSGQYINDTELQGTISVDGGASTGMGTVRVTNPDNQWDEVPFKVVAVVPNIAQINPNNADSNQQNVWVTITGSGFLSGIQATSSGSPLTIDLVAWDSATQVRVRVDCGFSLFGADRQIILTNPGGGTDEATFHITGVWE